MLKILKRCLELRFKVSKEDIVLTGEIKDKLARNKKLYGERYCPCVPCGFYSAENHEDFICPCKEFREEVQVGETCHCGLYVKEEM